MKEAIFHETKSNRLHLVPSESSAARGDPTGGKGVSGLMNITIPISLAPQFILLGKKTDA